MKTAKRNLKDMGQELKSMKIDLKELQRSNQNTYRFILNLEMKKDMYRAFNIAYFLKKNKIEFNIKSDINIIIELRLEKKSHKHGKRYIEPNKQFIMNYLEGFES